MADSRVEIVMREIGHYSCEDCFYSCPLSSEGSCNDIIPQDECNCGLEAKAQRVLAALDAAQNPKGNE